MSNPDRTISRPILPAIGVTISLAARECVRACPLAIIFALILPGALAGEPDGGAAPARCIKAGGVEVRVKAVNIHLEVKLTDGRLLRLAGIRAPRGTKAWPELAETARIALAGWIDGQIVNAEFDNRPVDRWGRIAARILAPDTAVPPRRRSVGAVMLEAGWALVEPAGARPDCLQYFYGREAFARARRLGLWRDSFYRVFDAATGDGLAARAGENVIVEGTVSDVRRWRSLTFINFGKKIGKERRKSASILLSKRARKIFENAGTPPESYRGKRIRMRGVLELGNGPRLRAYAPQFIEIVE